VPTFSWGPAYQTFNNVPVRIMVRNLATGTLTTLATDNGVTADGQVGHLSARVSPDGQRVAFASTSSTLVAGDTNGQADVFVRNLATGATSLASSSSNGTPGTILVSGSQSYFNVEWVNNAVLQFSVSQAHSLGPTGAYLKNVDTGALQLLLSQSDGEHAQVSADLSTMVFGRRDDSGNPRIFSRDLATGGGLVVSSSSTGVLSDGRSTPRLISRDGTRLVFNSTATNLVSPAPPAGSYQIYVKTIAAP
jgi:Tol biopolymer transport system component